MSVKLLRMASVDPVTVTILSGTDPSEMCILAPDSSLILLMISPPLPMMDPTSLPLMIMRMVRVTLGMSLGNGLSMSVMFKEVEDAELDWKLRAAYNVHEKNIGNSLSL